VASLAPGGMERSRREREYYPCWWELERAYGCFTKAEVDLVHLPTPRSAQTSRGEQTQVETTPQVVAQPAIAETTRTKIKSRGT